MKKLLLKRMLPFVMAIIMLASFCLPVGAFSLTAPAVDEEGTAYYSIELVDGVLQVKLNPQKLYDAMKDGDLSREELTQFIPEDVLNALTSPSKDTLLKLATEYVTPEDLEALMALLPQEIMAKYFLNPEFLESLITVDEILETVDLDALLSEIEDEEAFNAELNALLTPVLDDLLTENVRDRLLSNETFLKEILADTVDRILEEKSDEVMDALTYLITDEVVETILGNESYKSAIAKVITEDEAILNEILADPDLSHRLAVYLEDEGNRANASELLEDPAIIAEIQDHPQWMINEAVVKYMFTSGKLNTQVMHEVFGDEVINDLIKKDDYKILNQLMTSDTLIMDVVESDGFADLSAKLFDEALFETLMETEGFDLTKYVTLDQSFADKFGITAQSLIDKKYITVDNTFAAQFGITAQSLVDNGHVSKSEVESAILDGKLPADFTVDQLIALDLVDLAGVLADPAYGITVGKIVEKNLVDTDRILNDADYGITLEKLALSAAQLQTIAKDMLANDTTKSVIKDAFIGKIKGGAINPSEFIDFIDFGSIANGDNDVDLVGMVYDLLSTDEKADEHLNNLFQKVSLTQEEYKQIFNEIGYEECVAILESHLREILSDIGLDTFFAHFPVMELTDALFGTAEKSGFLYLLTTETYTPDDPEGTMLVSYDSIIVALGSVNLPNGTQDEQKAEGFAILINLLDPALIAEHLGSLLVEYITFSQIVHEVAGGYAGILSWYDEEQEVLLNALNEIGYDKLIDLLKNHGILESAAAKKAAQDLLTKITSDRDRLISFVKGLKDPLTKIAMEEIHTVELNDTVFFKNGRLDLQAAAYAVAASIPCVETFCDMSEGDAIYSLMMTATFNGADAPLVLGIEISFNGDFSQLQALAEQHKDLFYFEVNEDLDVYVSSVLPAKVADLYAKVLESGKLSDDLKAKLLTLPGATLPEAVDLLNTLSDQELNKLADVIDQKLDSVLSRADAVTSKLPDQVADRVDAILLKLSTADGLKDLIAKTESLVAKLPKEVKTLTVAGMYRGNGKFTLKEIAAEVDLAERIPQLNALPEGILDSTLSGSLSADITVKNLYRLTLIDKNAVSTEFFLPAGISLDILESVADLDLSVYGENLPATMPAADTRVTIPKIEGQRELIFVVQKPDGSTEELDRIYYMAGDTTLSREPATPAAIRGYACEMPDYLAEMNKVDSLIILLEYKLVDYKLIFNHQNGTNTVILFNVNSDVSGMTFPALTPDTVNWAYEWRVNDTAWTVDDFAAYLADPTRELTDITVVEAAVAKAFSVTFLNHLGEEIATTYYTSSGWEIPSEVPALPAAPVGYTHRWICEGKEWTELDPSLEKNLVVQVDRQAKIYTYTFVWYNSAQANTVVEYTIETLASDFANAVPALTEATTAYSYVWKMNGALWTVLDFKGVDAETLDNYTVTETREINTYTITLNTPDGAITVPYTVDTNLADVEDFFKLPADNKAYTYKWQKAVPNTAPGAEGTENVTWVDWSTDELFDENGNIKLDAGSYELRRLETPVDYTITVTKLNGTTVTLTYSHDTDKAAFLAMLDEVLTDNTANLVYSWKLTGTDTAWDAESFSAKLGGTNLGYLGDLALTEVEAPAVYTITFEMADGTKKYITYNAEGILTGSVPTLTVGSVAYAYSWQRDGAAWNEGLLDLSEAASYTVKETKAPVEYTMTFKPIVGEPLVLTYTIETNATEFKKLIPAVTEDAEKVYTYNWFYWNETAMGGSGMYEKWLTSDLRSFTEQNIAVLARTYEEQKRVHNYNNIIFQDENGQQIAQYYYDKENLYIRNDAGEDILVTELPTAPEIRGSSFAYWRFQGATQIAPNGTVFDLTTFRDLVTYGNRTKAGVKVRATYDPIEYTITFVDLEGVEHQVPYSVATTVADLNKIMPQLPANNNAYNYYWTDTNGVLWSPEGNFEPANELFELKDFTVIANRKMLTYAVTFVRADGTRTNVFLNILTTEDEFAAQIPELVNNAAFTRTWMYNGAEWTLDDLFGENGLTVAELGDYYIVENEIAYTFMLTFTDMDGNLINHVIYNGHGPLFGEIPAVPSSDDGYAYSWWNVTDDVAWAGFDPLECKNLELKLVRAPISYTLTFKIEGKEDVVKTYTVLDHSFEVPTVTPRAGYEVVWYYMEDDAKKAWTKDSLSVGDLVLTAEYVPLIYTVTFTAENGTEYVFTMTVSSKSNPSVPPKAGHIGTWYVQIGNAPADTDPTWAKYDLTTGGQFVSAYVKYAPLPYQISFTINGEFYRASTYTAEDPWTPPEAPAKEGYKAQWYIISGTNRIKWEDYDLQSGGSNINAELAYEPISYRALFYVDGQLLEIVRFTVEDKQLSKIPTIPAKEGYTAEWEAFTLKAEDLVIQAVYTPIEENEGGLHWIWWLIIILVIVLILLTAAFLLWWFCFKKKKDEPDPEPEVAAEAEPEVEVEPTPVVIPEITPVETVDVETADEMMDDAVAMAVLETVTVSAGTTAPGPKDIVNISAINEAYDANDTVDIDSLKEKGLLPAKAERVKVLADGHLDKPLTVIADSFSVQAIKMIALTGGTAIQKKINEE